MAAFLGIIFEFSSTLESCTAYIECLVQYLAANKIEESDQQRAVLLSICGPAIYRLIRNLVSPKKPHVVEIMQKHHDPKPSVIVTKLPSWRICGNLYHRTATSRRTFVSLVQR